MSSRPFATASLALPRLTRNEAEARTLLAQNVRGVGVLLGEEAWEFSIEPLARDATIGFGADDCIIRVDWAGAPFELRLPASAADTWLRGTFADEDWPSFPQPVRAAAFEAALQDCLQVLESAGRGPLRVDSIDEAPSEPAPATTSHHFGHHFGLSLAREQATVQATLSTNSFGLMLLAGLAAQHEAAAGPIGRADVPVLLKAEVGIATLAHAELRSLVPGDAVLLDEWNVSHEGELWLRHAEWGLKARIDGMHLEVTEPFGSMEGMMDDDYDDEEIDDTFADEAPLEIDAMPVRLHFDIGHRTLTLGELCQLQVGQVLELARPLSQAVSIRANGALVGTGELMEIGGRIAVAVTSLGARRGAPE